MVFCCLFIFSTAITVSTYATPNDATISFSHGSTYIVNDPADNIHHVVVYRNDTGKMWVLEQTVSATCSSGGVSVTLQQPSQDYGLKVYDCQNSGTLDSTWLILASDPTHPIMTTQAVGGAVVPIDKLALVAPYVGFASIIAAATVLTGVYLRRSRVRS